MATQKPQLQTPHKFPSEVEEYIKSKVEANGSGGRPHFLKEVSKDKDPKDVVLEIVERCWLKGKSVGSTAKKFSVKYLVIYRILQDLTPFKDTLLQYVEHVPRRKVFYNRQTDSSDYDTVQQFIKRSHRDEVKNYKARIMMAIKCWKYLKYKDPARWTADEVTEFLSKQSEGSQSGYLDGVRSVAPQIADKRNIKNYIGTGRYREKLRLRKKDLFGTDMKVIINALEEMGLTYHAIILKLHISIGAREGKGGKAGITGISWDRFKKNFTLMDDFESKVKGGIWWRNCPVDLFWKTLPGELKKLWIDRGKPITDKLILGGYPELTSIYREIRQALKSHFEPKVGKAWKVTVWKRKAENVDVLVKFFLEILKQKTSINQKEQNLQKIFTGHYEEADYHLDPSLFKEITTIRPHDADKIHCNLLWEADVKLEVVAGQYLGRGEGLGLMGRGWLSINTIKKHYLSLTQRSERFQETMKKVRDYSQRFNGGN